MGKCELKSNINKQSNSNGCDKLFVKCNCTCEETVTSNYILNINSTNDNDPNIAIATANKSCLVYSLDSSRIANIWEYNQEKDIVGCKFSHGNRNLLYVATSEGSIKMLDLRTQNFTSNFKDTSVENDSYKTFNCFDVSSNDRLLAAGTDVYDGDAYILFWDTRNQSLLGGYWEAHVDDITEVQFHPDNMNRLISGSTDGLINMYDLSQTSEDDALIDTLNTELSVSDLLWFRKSNKDCISCITHTSDVQLWDLDNGEPYKSFSRSELAKEITNNSEGFYVDKCHETKNGLLILAGAEENQKECLRASKIKNNELEHYVEFTNNKQRIRDSSFNKNNNVLITGGEEGLLNIWKLPDPCW